MCLVLVWISDAFRDIVPEFWDWWAIPEFLTFIIAFILFYHWFEERK